VGAGRAAPQPQADVGAQALEPATSARMENVFGENLSTVRVHTGDQAARLAEGFGARAITVSRDVIFGAGEYRPGADDGDALLAHELPHVVQQRDAGEPGPGRRWRMTPTPPPCTRSPPSGTLEAARGGRSPA